MATQGARIRPSFDLSMRLGANLPFSRKEMNLNKQGIKQLLKTYTKQSLLDLFQVTRPSLNRWLSSSDQPGHEAVTIHINKTVEDLLKAV